MSRHSAENADPRDGDPPRARPGASPTVDPHVVAGLHSRISALEAWRAHQTDLLDEILENLPVSETLEVANPDHVPDELAPVGLDLEALIDWVHHHVAAVIARPLRGEHRWCPRWWEHPEALFRFTALYHAWTELAGEPGAALSIWIRDHLDPCLRELLAPAGPFTDCVQSERYRAIATHTPLPTLPTTSPAERPGPGR
jgi:hypothetical protein